MSTKIKWLFNGQSGLSRFQELSKPVQKLFGSDLKVPLIELVKMLEPKSEFLPSRELTEREKAFHQIYYAYYAKVSDDNEAPCLKMNDPER